GQLPLVVPPVMDRWVVSTLARLVADGRALMLRYDVRWVLLKTLRFWDDLSTWYLRRNRARFWKARSRRDSLAAYQTMYEALTTLIGLFAPVMPFLSEDLYQGLVRSSSPSAESSVHLTAYPEERPDR